MKKLVYSLAVLFSVALVSCGGDKSKAADSDSTTVVAEEVTDTTIVTEASNDSTAAAAPTADTVKADSANAQK